ncbi:MAG: hydroxysqualene dehydroxylase HpnE [Bryobacteraceae bacterium]|nr:hydroxysqualene dehydroxylase HpnE [Bryobacteraceae bacterium]
MTPHVLVLGGGLAGLASAAALGFARYRVTVIESRPFLGGRATSYPAGDELIDNCQHILLRCCVNLVDFYARLEVSDHIDFHREFYFLEPGGRMSTLRRGRFKPPLHFAESFARASFLSLPEKLALGRALLALKSERKTRRDLDRLTMLDWLREKKQPQRVINRFWRQILVSAINEEIDRMSALHGFQVFWLGFLARANSYEMGVPTVPLTRLYGSEAWERMKTVTLETRASVERIVANGDRIEGVIVNGQRRQADVYISALPFERIPAVLPELNLDLSPFDHSPITGIHLWFDRRVTTLPHGTLLDRTIQWFFNKGQGRYIQVVVSASRSLVEMPKQEVVDLTLEELAEFLPLVKEAKLEKSHVVKEVRATFSARPGLEEARPKPATQFRNLFLAGDWTKSGWPATMEGAVRSGYIAAEMVTAAQGDRQHFLLPDLA